MNIPAIVVTDLDGTLLDSRTYSAAKAKEALDYLRQERIPVVFSSSKTRAEIELLRAELGVGDPFISENGGALFIPDGYFPSNNLGGRRFASYQILEFGEPYHRLVQALHRASEETHTPVRGFSDMSVEEVAAACQLSWSAAQVAKLREYDEPFEILDRSGSARSRLFEKIHRLGFRCTNGGRFHHVTGVTDKGRALRVLRNLYARERGAVRIIGLGDSLNDLPLLLESNVPVVVNSRPFHTTQLMRKVPTAWVTRAAGPEGWSEAIRHFLYPVPHRKSAPRTTHASG
jgi:mannosyl-3-phosphoglycerate phosphatase